MAKSKPQQARAAAEGVWGNPYLQRFIQDEELRGNVLDALDNARSAYGRLNNGKSASKVVMEDKKFQKDVKNAAGSSRMPAPPCVTAPSASVAAASASSSCSPSSAAGSRSR